VPFSATVNNVLLEKWNVRSVVAGKMISQTKRARKGEGIGVTMGGQGQTTGLGASRYLIGQNFT
jgi:hypothetical protein